MDTSRVRKPASRLYDIEIPLRERPQKYKGGSGPALRKIDIVLRNDSTAYITGREVLPLSTRDGHVRLQLHYIVRWEDLPSASVAIPATNICDYVSPRVLEDFEYSQSLEQDKLAEEARSREVAEEKTKAIVDALPDVPNGTNGEVKKRAPLSKVDLTSTEPSSTTSEDELALPLPSLSGPSLSTPKKRKNAMMERSTTLDETTDDPGIEGADLEQLHDETARKKIVVESSVDEGVDDTPTTQLDRSHILAKSSSSPFNHSTTPVPAPTRVVASSRPTTKTLIERKWSPKLSRTPIPVPKHPVQSAVSTINFTPAGCSPGSWSGMQTPVNRATKLSAEVIQSAPRSSTKKKRKPSRPSRTADAEPEYVITKLESYRTVEEDDGTQWRQWRVRWEGDWPADQNPTWEPESLLPATLVREFLKKAAKSGTAFKSPDIIHVDPGTGTLKRRYSSVAEAFEGEAEEQPNLDRDNTAEAEDDEDRFVVVEDEEVGIEEHDLQHIPIRGRAGLDFAHARSLYGELNGRKGGKTARPPL